MKNIVFILVSFVLFSCNEKKNLEDNSWIGGQIINPKSDYVILYKGENVIDSIKLDANNYFIYNAKALKEGLYSFSHYEFQVFYFEKGDSLMFRVNTMEFDESLSYSGRGSKKNNFLMDMFLINEKELEIMPRYYQKKQQEFEKSLDSLKKIKTTFYKRFIKKTPLHKDFLEIAKASIDYNYYIKKEIFASMNYRKKGSKYYEVITPSFFSYRDSINFLNKNLEDFFPYNRFLNKYFDNLITEKNNFYNKNTYRYNYLKLKLIDSLVKNQSLKNTLSKSLLYKYLVNSNKKDKQDELVNLFTKINTNQDHHDKIKEFSNTCKNLNKGKKIPNLLVVSTENTVKDLHSIINQPTILYFWSSNSTKHFIEAHNKANRIKEEFPNYHFLAINLDSQFSIWKDIIVKYHYNDFEEYQFKNVSKAKKELLILSINKAIIVNKNAEIINGNTNIFNTQIERLMLRAIRNP